MGNYITIPRCLFDDDAFPQEPYTRREAYFDLIQRASFEDKAIPYKGEVIHIHRGELAVSVRSLSIRWGWSKSKVEAVLKEFVGEERIGRRTDTAISIISISNYDVFQKPADTNKDADKDTHQDTDKDTNQDNNNKEINNKQQSKKKTSKDVKESKRFVPPTPDEVRAYCQENNYIVDADVFVNYYEQGGWVYGKAKTPMKDWKAAVRQWHARDKQSQTPTQQQTPPTPQEEPPKPKVYTYQQLCKFYPRYSYENKEQFRARIREIAQNYRDQGCIVVNENELER